MMDSEKGSWNEKDQLMADLTQRVPVKWKETGKDLWMMRAGWTASGSEKKRAGLKAERKHLEPMWEGLMGSVMAQRTEMGSQMEHWNAPR